MSGDASPEPSVDGDHGVPVTGHPEVDAALAGIAAVANADPAEQVPAYQEAHRVLRETLASLDDA